MQNDLFQTQQEQRRVREREGMLNKKIGINSVASRNAMFLSACRDWAMARSDWNGFVTVEDVRDWAQTVGIAPSHPNAWGALFKGNGWKPCGEHRNTIPSTHHRRVLMWKYQP